MSCLLYIKCQSGEKVSVFVSQRPKHHPQMFLLLLPQPMEDKERSWNQRTLSQTD